MMLDPFGTGVHVAHRRAVLLAEAERERLIAAARLARRVEGRDGAQRWAWRAGLYRLGGWLVETGLRLQVAAQPRVRLA